MESGITIRGEGGSQLVRGETRHYPLGIMLSAVRRIEEREAQYESRKSRYEREEEKLLTSLEHEASLIATRMECVRAYVDADTANRCAIQTAKGFSLAQGRMMCVGEVASAHLAVCPKECDDYLDSVVRLSQGTKIILDTSETEEMKRGSEQSESARDAVFPSINRELKLHRDLAWDRICGI